MLLRIASWVCILIGVTSLASGGSSNGPMVVLQRWLWHSIPARLRRRLPKVLQPAAKGAGSSNGLSRALECADGGDGGPGLPVMNGSGPNHVQ